MPRRLSMAVVMIALLVGALASVAAAQTPPAPSGAPVLIISVERVERDSQAGRGIREQSEALRDALREEMTLRREALRDEERELANLRDTLEREQFNIRVAAFEEKVRAFRRDEQDDSARLQRALARAKDELFKALSPLLIEIMSERGAGVLIDEKTVVLSATTLDVTAEAIRRLDGVAPRIEVRLPVDGGE